MHQVDVVAVVGACAPERRRFAERAARATGRALVTADRLDGADDPVLEAAGLAPWVHTHAGAIVELPATASTIELIGALTDPAASTRLSGIVCVVDAAHLLDDLAADDFVPVGRDDAGDGTAAADCTARALLTAHQLEFASSIVLVNWEPLPTPELATTMALVSHLSPGARLHLRDELVLALRPEAPYAAAQDRPGWVRVLNGADEPYLTDPRVRTLRYEQLRPFHPGRLAHVLDTRVDAGEFGLVVRSAGLCRFATRPGTLLQWDHVGHTIAFHVVEHAASLAAAAGDPAGPERDTTAGDPGPVALGQELAFIGLDLDREALAAALDAAALTDAELAAGPTVWAAFDDPFPAWVPADDRAEP